MTSPKAGSFSAINKMSEFSDLILGSGSPRRRDLLAQIGVTPAAIISADIDETPHKNEKPRLYVQRMAREKNLRLIEQLKTGQCLLTADTTVAVGRRILGKASDKEHARSMMKVHSGRSHQVMTAIALSTPDGRMIERLSLNRVKMKRLSHDDIERFIETEEWRDCAGGYKIQGYAAGFIQKIIGSHSAIMGLPLYETRQILNGIGYQV